MVSTPRSSLVGFGADNSTAQDANNHQVDSSPTEACAVALNHSRTDNVLIIDSAMRINELEEALKRHDEELEDMRRMLADRSLKNLSRNVKRKGPFGSSNKKTNHFDNRRTGKSVKSKWCRICKSHHRGPCSIDTMRCRNCGKKGHSYVGCKNETLCYACKKTGHISRDCSESKSGDDGEVKETEVLRIKGHAFMTTAEETDCRRSDLRLFPH